MLLEDICQAFEQVQFFAPSAGVALAGILACLLLLFSGFASGSEIAFFSLSPTDLSQLDAEKNTEDQLIEELRNDSERTLATILIMNNLINVTIIMLCNFFFAHVIDFGNAVWLQFAFLTILLTFLLLLFGEIMPKVYGAQYSLKFCRRAAPAICFCRRIFYPFSSILITSGVLAGKIIQKKNYKLSVNELEQALELTDTNEIKEDKNMLEGIVHFGDETAKEIMTSRQDIVDLEMRSSFSDVLKSIVDNNYSRIPVYQDNQDNMRGVLYIKDLLPHLGKPATFRWQSLIRPPYFVPETKKIADLLREFQDNKVHIAIVVDEFGGTSGIVTLEDIIEEIVGEINDEFDEDEKPFVRIDSNTFIFEGKTLLSDFYKVLDLDTDIFDDVEGDADTIAGLLLELKGDFPQLNEIIRHGDFCFSATEIDGHRIAKVKVKVSGESE